MSRPYAQKRRAEQAAETRARIVDATVELHGTIGPARTTMSMIAERAGVQRHTLYAHFPEERDLFLACSGTSIERDPLPDAAAWADIRDPGERLRAGLGAVHDWHARNAGLMACVLRDGEVHAMTREIVGLRVEPVVAGWHRVLGEMLDDAQRPMLELMLSFHSWRTLAEAGLAPAAMVELMVRAVLGSSSPRT